MNRVAPWALPKPASRAAKPAGRTSVLARRRDRSARPAAAGRSASPAERVPPASRSSHQASSRLPSPPRPARAARPRSRRTAPAARRGDGGRPAIARCRARRSRAPGGVSDQPSQTTWCTTMRRWWRSGVEPEERRGEQRAARQVEAVPRALRGEPLRLGAAVASGSPERSTHRQPDPERRQDVLAGHAFHHAEDRAQHLVAAHQPPSAAARAATSRRPASSHAPGML